MAVNFKIAVGMVKPLVLILVIKTFLSIRDANDAQPRALE